jgi:Opioid growth factor receptor (OGFr) conserved region
LEEGLNFGNRSSLVAFYAGQMPDSEGRRIEDIWSWDYERLEYVHDYIQWLFPLNEPSAFNMKAPILDDQTIQAFKTNPDLRVRLIKSFKLMLKFYGLRCIDQSKTNIAIVRSEEYSERKVNWIRRGNHNYLRLTRILLSLKTLGLGDHAVALFESLEEIYKEESTHIGSTTYLYWKRAVRN